MYPNPNVSSFLVLVRLSEYVYVLTTYAHTSRHARRSGRCHQNMGHVSPRTFIPQLYLRLLWLFSRSASLFRQNRGFSQLFRFCSDLRDSGIWAYPTNSRDIQYVCGTVRVSCFLDVLRDHGRKCGKHEFVRSLLWFDSSWLGPSLLLLLFLCCNLLLLVDLL